MVKILKSYNGKFPRNSLLQVFTETGFSNWKVALESNRGLKKHDNSEGHKRAMARWDEMIMREKLGKRVEQLVEANPEHEQWLEAVFDNIKFLTANGLPLRGNTENTDFESGEFSGFVCVCMRVLCVCVCACVCLCVCVRVCVCVCLWCV